MHSKSSTIIRKRKKNYFLRTILILALTLGLTVGIAALWQKADNEKYGDSPPKSFEFPEGLLSFADTIKSLWSPKKEPQPEEPSPDISSSESSSESTSSMESLSEPEPESEPALETLYNAPVPESEPVDESYFNDAVFIGDSLTEGIKAYALLENTTVLSGVGVNVDSILTKECISSGGGRVTIPDALLRLDSVGKIYVMIGANGIGWMDDATFIKKYGAFIDKLIECQPTADIYIQSILPVNEEIALPTYGKISNEDISGLDLKLQKLAEEKSVYYVDVASAFRDESGSLPADATPDGIHLNAPYYQTWFDYLMCHVAPKKK